MKVAYYNPYLCLFGGRRPLAAVVHITAAKEEVRGSVKSKTSVQGEGYGCSTYSAILT